MKQVDNFNPGRWLVENKLTSQSKLGESRIINPKEPHEDVKPFLLDLIQFYSRGNDNEYEPGTPMTVDFEGINYDDWDMEPEDRREFRRVREYLNKKGPVTFKDRINYTFSTSADGQDIIMNWIEPDWDELNGGAL
jgi:hypothetical protein